MMYRKKLQACWVFNFKIIRTYGCINIKVFVCVHGRERLMRQVLALVTLSHITISSSLSVRASSYLISFSLEHLNKTLNTHYFFFILIQLKTGKCCHCALFSSVMFGAHPTKRIKSWTSFKK